MKKFKVLGSGCAKCQKTAELIEAVALKSGTEIELTHETNPESIMRYGVMSTPAVVCDEKVIHTGSVPSTEIIASWLSK
ncbi:thioredoxin family protein [Luteithermobacter gelatinilyticus]|uniref:thioredoxin family protein n=1 Tax=Luteithermobacter gelatinilyticus TaxID=2582913 RepID=UPI0011062BBD|nr:thioredoxin family protein [Luteithermobacter gelatinilyticus]|tara:strand:- start:138 stop:374 length:237 start_codon:yes stop_codon:yes gene_type:complete